MEYDGSNCIVKNLSLDAGKRLMELRKQVAMAFNEGYGPDLGFEISEPKIKYLEAYERYSGHLYGKIFENSWNKLNRNPELKLVIVSALYGFVNYNESIRYYNRTMKDYIYPGKLLKTWWSNQSLSEILLDYVTQNGIQKVHNFLSTDYAQALSLKEIKVQHIPHTYPGVGSGSDYHRGRDVNTLIQSLKA